MGKSLVIVESPAKAKTINKYLGNEFIVESSVGHIRDLPTAGSKKTVDAKERARQAAITRKMAPEEKAEYKKKKAEEQLFTRMGVDPRNGWSATYEILPNKEKVVNQLKKLAAKADTIYLATDLDREGEAIAWHLKQAIGSEGKEYKRVVFNEITKKAIQAAFNDPGELDYDRVNAQQARRFLDRVVGFMVSPLLWAKIARGLSAGRVQSVAVRLIVEREREIRAFVPEEYWEVFADTHTAAKKPLRLQVVKHLDKTFRPGNEEETNSHLKALQHHDFVVERREDKPTQSRPSAPFITSTLQQAASTRLGFGVKKTMMLAQRLYEAGYITYMRTDSTNLSGDAIAAARGHIGNTYGDKYLPEKPRFYSSKEGAQEAHEAIRPSDVSVSPGQIRSMDRDAERLYELIRCQFIACQMTNAEYNSSTIFVTAGDYSLKTRGRVMLFDGYLRALPAFMKKDDDVVLPDIQAQEKLSLQKLDPTQHFTKPPPRYSEAALVKELEKRGIGRPSTYASIISTIQERGYVRLDKRRFYAEKMGDIVTDRLVESFDDLMDFSFTAKMEDQLDEVASGTIEWKDLLDSFYANFSEKLEKAGDKDHGMRANEPVETDIDCGNCGRKMQIRTASTGVFLGCSGYSLPPKERCKNTMNLIPGDEVVSADEDEEGESRLLLSKKRCKKCGTAMDSYLIDAKRKIHICGNNPDCEGNELEEGEFKIKGYDGPVLECDKCQSEMQLKSGRFGKYFDCTNENCSNTRKLLKNGQPAPPKMDPVDMPELACQKVEDHYVLRDGASGLFLAASQFPKNRETRAPALKEILPHKSEIDPKYAFLFDGPTHDKDGNPSIIRFSRKSQEQYLMSETSEGKASGWTAHYRDGKWVQSEAKAKTPRGARKKAAR